MRPIYVILGLVGSTVPMLAAQLAGPQTPAAAHAQNDHNPFAGKVLVFPTDVPLYEIQEDIRIASLEGTGFFVLRPAVVTHDGKTHPKRQIWRKMSTVDSFYVFETRTAADEFIKHQKATHAKLNPGSRLPQVEYLPHPASENDPFNGKAVLVYCGKSSLPILVTDWKIYSAGGEVYFSWSSDHLNGARSLQLLSTVEKMVVFDSIADTRSDDRTLYNFPPELKSEKADSDTDSKQR